MRTLRKKGKSTDTEHAHTTKKRKAIADAGTEIIASHSDQTNNTISKTNTEEKLTLVVSQLKQK